MQFVKLFYFSSQKFFQNPFGPDAGPMVLVLLTSKKNRSYIYKTCNSFFRAQRELTKFNMNVVFVGFILHFLRLDPSYVFQ